MNAQIRWVAVLAIVAGIALCLGSSPPVEAAQLLSNSGFEEGTPLQNGDSCGGQIDLNGWNWSSIDPVGPQLCMGYYTGTAAWSGGPQVHSGSNSVRAFHYGGWDATPGHLAGERYGIFTQVAEVVPNQNYTAAGWVYIWRDLGIAESPNFFCKLIATELTSADAVVVVHQQDITTFNQWVNPTLQFKASAQTAKVRYQFEFRWEGNLFATHLNFDDLTLVGPAANAKLIQGTVTSGGAPVEGATVTAGSESVTTAANGTYTVELPGAVATAAVRASKDGLFAQRKYRSLTGASTVVDFDLVAVGSNLLVNAGFDDNANHDATVVPDNWALQGGGFGKESYFLEAFYTNYIRSGEEAAGLLTDNVPEEFALSQTVTILPNEQYTAKAWIRAAGEGTMWYSGSPQKAALRIQQIDKGGTVIDERYEYLTSFNGWQQKTYTFTSKPNAGMVTISCWANMAERFSDTLARAVFDDVELNGPSGGPLPGLFGVVKSGETFLSAAKVSLMNQGPAWVTLSDEGGAWAFQNPGPGGYAVRGVKAGYYPQRLARVAPNVYPIVFDLVEMGNNILVNAGFDDGWNEGGWIAEASGAGPSYTRAEGPAFFGTLGGGFWASGEEAVGLFASDGAPGGMWYYQSVPVVGGSAYTCAAKFKPSVSDPNFTSTYNNPADEQVAGLLVKEYNASGGLIVEHPLIKAQETGGWETLTGSFTANAATKTIQIGPYVWQITNSRTSGWDRATFDDIELRGPLGEFGLSGTVTSNGSPVAGVLVAVTNPDDGTAFYTTDAQGKYVATVLYGSSLTVGVSKGGYYPSTKTVAITGQMTLDFSMYPVGNNQVRNPGFDDAAGWLAGGWVQASASVWPETNTGQFGPMFVFTPSQATYIRGPGSGTFYQDVPVVPGETYEAVCWFRAGTDPRYGSVWGVNASQEAALSVRLLDMNKGVIGTEQRAYATVTTENRDQYQKLTLNVPTTGNTAFVRIGGWANMIDNYDANLARALFDQFELDGPGLPGSVVGDIKAQADGTNAVMVGKVVSARYNGFFYVQEADRSSGIRVNGIANAGDLVDIDGTLSTVNGERQITTPSIVQRASGEVPEPLGTNQRSVNIGVSPVGLYMVMWGRVDSADSINGVFTMTDGSGASIKVYGTAAVSDYVKVTGAVGAEMAGEAAVPVLRSVEIEKVD